MPSIEGIKILVDKEKPDKETLIELLEKRRILVKPLFENWSLKTVEDYCMEPIEWLGPDTNLHWVKVNGFDRLSLKTRCLLFQQPFTKIKIIPHPHESDIDHGIRKWWGLDRNSRWILVTEEFTRRVRGAQKHFAGATKIEIKEKDLSYIIAAAELKPRDMCRELGKEIISLACRRRELFEAACYAAEIIGIENQLFCL